MSAGSHRTVTVTRTSAGHFTAVNGGDAARAILPDVVRRSHDRLCTVSRTVELGTPVATPIETDLP